MKWEYKTVKISHDSRLLEDKPGFEAKELDNFINEFGRDGWELISVEGIVNSKTPFMEIMSVNTTAIVLFFKRPLSK